MTHEATDDDSKNTAGTGETMSSGHSTRESPVGVGLSDRNDSSPPPTNSQPVARPSAGVMWVMDQSWDVTKEGVAHVLKITEDGIEFSGPQGELFEWTDLAGVIFPTSFSIRIDHEDSSITNLGFARGADQGEFHKALDAVFEDFALGRSMKFGNVIGVQGRTLTQPRLAGPPSQPGGSQVHMDSIRALKAAAFAGGAIVVFIICSIVQAAGDSSMFSTSYFKPDSALLELAMNVSFWPGWFAIVALLVGAGKSFSDDT